MTAHDGAPGRIAYTRSHNPADTTVFGTAHEAVHGPRGLADFITLHIAECHRHVSNGEAEQGWQEAVTSCRGVQDAITDGTVVATLEHEGVWAWTFPAPPGATEVTHHLAAPNHVGQRVRYAFTDDGPGTVRSIDRDEDGEPGYLVEFDAGVVLLLGQDDLVPADSEPDLPGRISRRRIVQPSSSRPDDSMGCVGSG